MSLPQYIIDKYKPLADGTRFRGRDIESMSKDELLTVIGWLHADMNRTKERCKKQVSLIRDINSARVK